MAAIIRNVTILIDLIYGVFVLTALGAYFGSKLDARFGTSPYISVGLGIFAIMFGLTRLVLKAKEYERSRKNK